MNWQPTTVLIRTLLMDSLSRRLIIVGTCGYFGISCSGRGKLHLDVLIELGLVFGRHQSRLIVSCILKLKKNLFLSVAFAADFQSHTFVPEEKEPALPLLCLAA